MKRRRFLTISTLLSAVPLIGCVTSPTGQVAPVDFATVQLWSQDLTDAIAGVATMDVMPNPAISPTIKRQVQLGLAVLQTGNATLHGATAPTNPRQVVNEIVQGVMTLLPLLAPLVPALAATNPVGMGVQLGVLVLMAFVNATPMAVPPVPAALHRSAMRYRGQP